MSIATGENPLDTPLGLFIIQMVIIVVMSRLLTWLFKFIHRKTDSFEKHSTIPILTLV